MNLFKFFFYRILSHYNYEINIKNQFKVAWPIQPDEIFINHFELIKTNTMVNTEGLVSLYDQVCYLEKKNIQGAFVECGTWKGGCAGLMALGNMEFGSERRKIHLFDSFEGIPEPQEGVDGSLAIKQSEEWSDGGKSGGMRSLPGYYDNFGGVGTLSDNKKLMEEIVCYPAEYIKYQKGWFTDTIPKNKIEKISLLRIDADWYASTKICLDYLAKLVVKNGFIIIDDYGAYDGCKKAVDEYFKGKHYFHRVNQDIMYVQI